MIAYAFFESIRIGADYSEFLCEDLILSGTEIKEYLGDYVYVLPTENPLECQLVYKKSAGLYEVLKFKVLLSDGKITDIQN